MRLTTSRRAKVTAMRTLTVSSLHREWGEAYRKRECLVPSIRLNGKWLSALGVVPGQKIRVVTNGTTITLVPVGFQRVREKSRAISTRGSHSEPTCINH